MSELTTVRGILGVLALVGTFAILGLYVWTGEKPDAAIMGLVGSIDGSITGFIFGRANGMIVASK